MVDYKINSASRWKFYKWRPSVAFVARIAKMASNTLLIIGSFSSGCAGFRAIPILVALAPFNVLVIPKFIVTFLCFVSFIAGSVAFYTQYNEDVAKITARFVEWYAYPRPIPISENSLSSLQSQSNYISASYTIAKIQNDSRILLYAEKLKQISSKISAGTLADLRLKLQEIEDRDKIPVELRQPVIDKKNELTEKFTANKLHYYFVKFMSWAFILLGFAVVVGMGILANQGVLLYFGVEIITNTMLTVCFLGALLKQLCQITSTAEKQDKLFCQVGLIAPNQIDSLKNSIGQQELIRDYHAETTNLLDNFKDLLDKAEQENQQDSIITLAAECKKELENQHAPEEITKRAITWLRDIRTEAVGTFNDKQELFVTCLASTENLARPY